MKLTTKLIFLAAALLLGTVIPAWAQVKITDGAVITLDQNSLLELESTNKGLLIPRMAINDVNQVSPLTGTVPTGMLVYSTGGSVADGFYYWNGSQWKRFVQTTVQVNEGGTGLTSGTSGGIPAFTGITTITSSGLLTQNALVVGGGAGATPSTLSLGTLNQLLGMNAGGTANEYKTLNGTANQISVTNAAGNITLSTPQDISTTSSPTFVGLTLTNPLSVANGGTGSSTQNFVDLTTPQTVAGAKTWSSLSTFNLGLTSTGAAVNINASSDFNTNINTGTSIGAVTLGGSGVQTIAIGNNAAGAKTIPIGNSVIGSTVTVLSGTGATSLTLNSNNGSAATAIGTGTTTGAVTIGGSSNSVYLPKFSTAGVIHNDATGLLSSSLIVDSDITNSTINLTTKVTGTLPVANGGTGLSSGTSGGILAFTGSGTIASSGLLTQNAVVIGGGAGVAPSTISTGTAGQILTSNGTSAPYWSEGDRWVRLTSDVTSSVTSFADVTGLYFTPEANKDYYIEFDVLYTTSSTGKGIYLAVNGPAGITGMGFMTIAFTNATTLAGRTFNAYDTGGLIGSAITGYNHATVSGILRNGANSSSFILRFASEGGGGATATVKTGSVLRYIKLN